MKLSRRSLVFSLPLVMASRSRANEAPVRVLAAMTFRPALDRVLSAYREAGGAAVAVYAPTPVLIRLLAEGAPADILLTADPEWMDEAVRQSLVQPETRSNLVTNDLVLAGAPGSEAVETITSRFPLEAVLQGGRLALCDPDHDPAGRYARQSLQALGFWKRVEASVAIAESAPAAVVMVDHGEVRAAVCFRTDLHGDDHAMVLGTFPAHSHAAIVYPVALTRDAESAQAHEALAFLLSPASLQVLTSFGYLPAP
jgi:molybdate transport system substrate-binding protein